VSTERRSKHLSGQKIQVAGRRLVRNMCLRKPHVGFLVERFSEVYLAF